MNDLQSPTSPIQREPPRQEGDFGPDITLDFQTICSDFRFLQTLLKVDEFRRSTRDDRLSDHDAHVLAFLSMEQSTTAAELARNLRGARSSIGDILLRLRRLGYIDSYRASKNSKILNLKLSEKGQIAMQRRNAVNPRNFADLLGTLSATERSIVIEGLLLIVSAAKAKVLNDPERSSTH